MLNKVQKTKILEDLKDKIAKQKAAVFVDFTGLKVKDLSELRKKVKEIDGELKVAKKTLAQIAFGKESKIDIRKLKGEVAIAFGFKDEFLPAKTVWQFSKTHPNLKILGGIFENQFAEAEKIIELAKLPSRNELLTSLVYVLEANIKGLMYLLTIIKK